MSSPSFGLSLCIQGTQSIFNSIVVRIRFIPVYTGNTMPLGASFLSNAVYPCVYREHMIAVPLSEDITGLSLCIQGTLH